MIDCLICSVGEPQLDRALEAIHTQTVPFSNVIHISDVVPAADAYNKGLSMLKDKWYLLTAGDMILYPYAVERITEKINIETDDKIVGHLFGTYDIFLKEDCPGVGTYRTDVVGRYPFLDRLSAERSMGKKLVSRGWDLKRHDGNLGTHFDNPDDFQVFRRFYRLAIKYRGDFVARFYDNLSKLFDKTGDPLYQTAMRAMIFAPGHRDYPGSHNHDFDKKMYEVFNAVQAV